MNITTISTIKESIFKDIDPDMHEESPDVVYMDVIVSNINSANDASTNNTMPNIMNRGLFRIFIILMNIMALLYNFRLIIQIRQFWKHKLCPIKEMQI
jgi:hypothetical protein